MDAKEPWLAVLKALIKSKATWKLVGTIAVLFGMVSGGLIAELVGDVLGDAMGPL